MNNHLFRFKEKEKFVFIDCETENLCLNYRHNIPWQIAMIKVVGDKIIEEKDMYVEWDRPLKVSPEAAIITQFSEAKYNKLKIPYEQVYRVMKDWLEDADYIVGHNILGFDAYLISEFYKKMGESSMHLVDKFIDTLCVARMYRQENDIVRDQSLIELQYQMLNFRQRGAKNSLSALGKEFEVDHDYKNLHNALVDLQLNIKVWDKLKWKVNI